MKEDSGWQRYWRYLSARFRGEVDDELAFHVEMRARELEKQGLDPAAARREAERRFGDSIRIRATLHGIERKRGRRMALRFVLDEVTQDIRHAARGLLRRPGFALMTASSLALGIAATTVVLSAIDAYLLRPLPVRDPGDLVVIGSSNKAFAGVPAGVTDLPTVHDLGTRTDLFDGVAGVTTITVAIRQAEGDRAERHFLSAVTGGYFPLLGISAGRGRLLGPDDDRRRERVMVVSHRFWTTALRSDPAVIGKRLHLNTLEFVVVGVAPVEFRGTEHAIRPDGYVPSSALNQLESLPGDIDQWRGTGRFLVLARRQPGRTIASIQSALDGISKTIEAAHPQVGEDYRLRAVAESRARPTLASAGGAVVAAVIFAVLALLVLLTAAVNATNLILARGTARSSELAVRQALGAPRFRLVRQLLTETVMMALLALAGGWILARLAVAALTRIPLDWNGLPLSWGLAIDLRIFGMTVAITLLVGVLAGLGPALSASRFALQHRLREGGRAGLSRRGRRARSALVVAQVAASLVVLVCAGLFFASARQGNRVDLGFRPERMMTFGVDATLGHRDETAAREAFDRIERAVEALPGVRSAVWSNMIPIKQGAGGTGEIQTDDGGSLGLFTGSVGAGYFEVLEMPIVEGRGIELRDDSTRARVIVLNQPAAEQLWPGKSAVGRTIRLARDGPPFEVIGVVRGSRYFFIGERPMPYGYLALAQERHAPALFLSVRTAGDPSALAEPIRAAVAAVDRDLGPFDTRTMEDVLENTVNGMLILRLGAGVAAAIGVLAVGLTLVGLYGVIVYSVVQRTREIGLRIALGATRETVVRSILRDGGVLALGGVVIGLMLAFLLGQALAPLLIGSRSADPVIFGGVAAGLTLAALLSAYLPARRAARIDPVKALTEG